MFLLLDGVRLAAPFRITHENNRHRRRRDELVRGLERHRCDEQRERRSSGRATERNQPAGPMPESWFRAFRNDSMKVGGFGRRVAVQAAPALSQILSCEKVLGSLVGKYDCRISADEQYAFIEATEGCDRGDLKKF